jgi:hypothetical protein
MIYPMMTHVGESISHLLVQCSFSQQIWHTILSKLNLLSCMSRANENFNTCFASAAVGASPPLQKDVKSFILLVGRFHS